MRQVRASKKTCCKIRFDTIIFGRIDPARHILQETFDGQHFFIDGPDNNKIDAMFFPCTSKEEILCDNEAPIDGSSTRFFGGSDRQDSFK